MCDEPSDGCQTQGAQRTFLLTGVGGGIEADMSTYTSAGITMQTCSPQCSAIVC